MSDINNIKPSTQNGLTTRNINVENKRTEATPEQTKSTGAAMDKVSLTASATQLQALQREIAALPVIDEQKVNAIRAAIEDGSYQIDNEKLARNMMDFEGNL